MLEAMERLLVFGDDASPGADDAWRWIDAQRWPGWRVEVLSADPPSPGPPLSAGEVAPHPWQPAAPRVPSSSSAITVLRHLKVRSDPRIALLRSDADLIVIGPRGEGMLKALHLGSTADYLLHHPPAPLVIARAPRPVTRVLLGADGSVHSRRAVEVLAGLPWIGGTEVAVVGVKDGAADLDEAAEHACGVLEGRAAAVSTRRTVGHTPSAILDAAADLEADLIVLGTRGLLGVRRVLLGSTTSAVAQVAPCSVLAACAEDSEM